MNNLTEQEAAAKISDLLAEAQTLVYEAEWLADKYNIGFRMNLGEYGMGGFYDGDSGSWKSSSQNC